MKRITSLRGRKAFARVKFSGRSFESNLLGFFYEFLKGQTVPIRVGVVVAKRHGSAVRRSLLKRWIREACRLSIGPHAGPLRESLLSVVVVAVYRGPRQRSSSVSFNHIKADVASFVGAIQTSFVSK